MAIQWQSLLFKILVWFSFEIILTCLGFDDLADYSEFILETKKIYVYQMYHFHSTLAIQNSLGSNKIICSEIVSN